MLMYSDPQLATFSLRGRRIDELRELARRHLKNPNSSIDTRDKTELIAELSEAASGSKELSRELRKDSISLKPSFYLMRFGETSPLGVESARKRLTKYLDEHSSGLQELQIQLVQEPAPRTLQVLLTWQTPYTYWAPTFALEQVQQLKFGFVVVDFKVRKAILCCHTTRERDEIAELTKAGLGLPLQSLVLTKQLLDQIGTYDHVKRALYTISKPDATTPANITYADDRLAARSLARMEEDNPRSQRQQSFYRIPITDELVEEGLGATSSSGKLWIPKEVPVESVREYCSALLKRISGTLDQMTKKGDIEGILSTFDFEEMPDLAGADPLTFRRQVAELLREIMQMLSGKETDRAYIPPFELVRYGAPLFFFHPRLRLTDPESGEVSNWFDSKYRSSQVSVSGTAQRPSLRSYPADAPIDASSLSHPTTGADIALDNPLEHLELVPNDQFARLIQDVVRVVSEQIPILKGVGTVAFRLSGGLIKLDIGRAFGKNLAEPSLLGASDIVELREPIAKHPIGPAKRSTLAAKLAVLGEKCKHMSDENCRTCVKDRERLCVRSLVGHYLKKAEILAHKNIELYDMGSTGTVGGQERRMWGFAKLPGRKSDAGLTLRNKAGAILMSQILGQIDKASFRTVLVISPSVVNQDFSERAHVLCSAFGKDLCFLDADDLARILLDFEEQAKFDGLDIGAIYKRSRTKSRKKALCSE
jgi:hypothetical protein